MIRNENDSPAHPRSRQSQQTTRPWRATTIGVRIRVAAAIIATGAIACLSLMLLPPENVESTRRDGPTVATSTTPNNQAGSTSTSLHPPRLAETADVQLHPVDDSATESAVEAPLTPDMLEPDGDNAPPEADVELVDDRQRTNEARPSMTESEFLSALRHIATDPTDQAEFDVDAVWAYALDHHQEQQAIAALTPRLQAQDPAIVAHAREAIANLSEAAQRVPSSRPLQDDATISAYVARLAQTALTDSDAQQRFEAVAELGGHPQQNSVAALIQAINDPDARNRNQAVLSLANIAPQSSDRASILALLERIKNSGDAELTATAEQALQARDKP